MQTSLPWLLLLLTACPRPDDTDLPTGESVFTEGCPAPGQALARRIGVDDPLPGRAAVTQRGDFLLANERAAFVITEPDKGSTYYYYGGVVADAVAVDGCEIVGEDKLDEVGLVLGHLDLTDFVQSILRGFRGETAEVVNDGSDGQPAVVRVTGTDDTYWLVEYELILAAVHSGGRPVSPAWGVEVVVDYTLEPDSPVLRIDVAVHNTTDEPVQLFSAALLSFGETLDLYRYATDSVSLGSLNMQTGIPWLVATDGAGALAWGVEDGSLAYTRIAGIDVAADAIHATTEQFDLAPGATGERTSFLAVGPSDGVSATVPLALANPEPLPGQSVTMVPVTGTVSDPNGVGVGGSFVSLRARAPMKEWGTLDEAVAAADGTFTIEVPEFTDPWAFRLSARATGRDPGTEVDVVPGEEGVTLPLPAVGHLSTTIVDARGDDAPARLALERDDGWRTDLWLAGAQTTPVPPGSYDYTATRGYEFAPVTGQVEVPPDGEATLDLEMVRIVDTTGFLSIDTHVHSSDSPDSRTNPADLLLHAAAHGLDVVLHTEHEYIVDKRYLPAEAGLDAWITNAIGQEVTAPIPEHLTMMTVEEDGSYRGGFVQWYGLDIAELFAAMHERSGGGVNIINHPGYLDLVGWDRVSAEPTFSDPTLLGLAAGAQLWSWDLEGIEVMNGHGNPFIPGNQRWDNWQSMLNAGHRVIAIGSSDDHGGTAVGFPRTYFAAPSDDPRDFEESDLLEAFFAGRALVSTGAFARVSVDGAGLGEQVTDTDGTVALDVHIEALPEIDVTHVSVFVNCDEALVLGADDPDGVVKLDGVFDVPVTGDAQVTIAAFGTRLLPAGMPQFPAAKRPRVLTNPIYVDGDGDGQWSAPGGRECSYTLAAP